jgi:pyruvate kinase
MIQTKTKIVCTLGPSSNTGSKLKNMIKTGMDVVRINFSHGTHEEHSKIIKLVRKTSNDIAILIDLSGPKFRIGEIKKPFEIKPGDKLVLTSEEIVGDRNRVSVNHKLLPQEVSPKNELWINDGLVMLQVDRIEEDVDIHTTCIVGGSLSSRKGINAPQVPISLYFPTKKDTDDAKFALDYEPDYFAASFVRREKDLKPLRELIEKAYKNTHLISKIEHRDALKNIDSIIKASDGIMVARGDLGLEIPTEDVPLVQKDLIKKCNIIGKPVITATQMLESMTSNPRPTRAEASDVSNAVIDGTDAVMLSGETSVGKFPIETIDYMNRIAHRAEEIFKSKPLEIKYSEETLSEVLGHAAQYTASGLDLAGIIAITRTGSTARLVAKYRPKIPIIGATSFPTTYRQLNLVWGVNPLLIDIKTTTDQIILESVEKSLDRKFINEEDKVLVIAGTLLGIPAKTNLIQVVEVSEILSVSDIITKDG